ncbi:hypothetical protein DFJ74DRAFT_676419 [Hyaloraphidium curvatum]|nr:hypothetical protein DFJ74DRAFT_676419 [Hyaloraphidium curvatum]
MADAARPAAKDPIYRLLDILIPLLQYYGFYLLIIGGSIWYLWPRVVGERLSRVVSPPEDPEVQERKRREAWLRRQEEMEQAAAERRRQREQELAEASAASQAEPKPVPIPPPEPPAPRLPPVEAVREAWGRVSSVTASGASSNSESPASPVLGSAERVSEPVPEPTAAEVVGTGPIMDRTSSEDTTSSTEDTEAESVPRSAAEETPATSPPNNPPSAAVQLPSAPEPHLNAYNPNPYADRPPPPIFVDLDPEAEAELVRSPLYGSDTSPSPRGNDFSHPFRILWTPGAHRTPHPSFRAPTLLRIVVFAGLYLDGLEFQFRDADTVRVGRTSGTVAGQIEIRHGDYIRRVHVRSGEWVDALAAVISGGRELPWCGGTGGEMHEFEPPINTRIVGFWGYAGYEQGIDGFGVVCAPVSIKE